MLHVVWIKRKAGRFYEKYKICDHNRGVRVCNIGRLLLSHQSEQCKRRREYYIDRDTGTDDENLDKNFPATPREVVKLYNRIITCFYNDEYTDDELYDLGDQARKLFDDELLENNPRDEYFKNLKEDISEYHDKNKTIGVFCCRQQQRRRIQRSRWG